MPRSILIVDDNEMNRMVLQSILCDEYTVVEAENGAEAMTILQRMDQSFAAVMLDLAMPVMNGYQVLEQMQQSPVLSQIPIIVTTGSNDGESEIKALNLGATDYITKPYNPDIVLRRVGNLIKLRESSLLISVMRNDKLTGLLNREPFFAEAAEKIAAAPAGYYLIAAIDIDKFSLINDQYGNHIGDEVLKRVAEVLSRTAQPLDGLCARMTADNFALLYPAALRDTNAITHGHLTTINIGSDLPPLTFSIGRYIVEDPTLPVSGMYDRAFLAKGTVKGRYDKHIALYDEAMRKDALRNQRIVDEMKDALAEGQFEAWFQPQYNNYNGALIGAEALARWRHPEKGLVPPGVFIPVFEQNGFIYELDKCIWEQTCAFLRQCMDEGGKSLPVSVNISRYDVFREDLVDFLTGLLTKYALPAELLRIEITESAFANDASRIIQVVSRFVALGFTVEIDDFGSGYSSLNILKDVPAQIIKLDMRFLEGSDNLERGGSIIESIVRMARWLGMTVIAEGVETAEQADYLKSIGCAYSQGYFFGRPMPKADYTALLNGAVAEKKLLAASMEEHLDNAFWDPGSMDTLIFNSYVGAACIFEYHGDSLELLRVSAKYAHLFSEAELSTEYALQLDWAAHLSEESAVKVKKAIAQSVETHEDVTCELVFLNIKNCPPKVYLRFHLRVIAVSGDRYLVYATYENLTAQREAERKERETANRLAAILAHIDMGVAAAAVDENGGVYTVFGNDAYYAMLGYTRAQYEDEVKNPLDVVLPEDKPEVLTMLSAVLESDCECKITYRCRRRDGEVRAFRCHGSAIGLDGVENKAILRVMTDVTERAAQMKR